MWQELRLFYNYAKIHFMKTVNTSLKYRALALRGSVAIISASKSVFFGIFAA